MARYIKMKIVLLFYFMMPGRSLMQEYDYDYNYDNSYGFPLTRTSGIVGTSNFHQGEAECKCSSFSRGLRGNCQSKYKGYYWCYLEENKHEGCADFTKSKRRRGYWSWSACYDDDTK